MRLGKVGEKLETGLSGIGSLGSLISASVAMGCCAGFLAPLASIAAAGVPLLDSPSFQMPALYAAVCLNLTGLVTAYRRHRSPWYLVPGLTGAVLLLIPFHTALDLQVFYFMVGLGLTGLLIASWGPFLSVLKRRVGRCSTG